MGSVIFASRAARCLPVASLCSFEGISRKSSVIQPLFVFGNRSMRDWNSSTTAHFSNFHSSSTLVRREFAVRFTCRDPRLHPVFKMMRSPSRGNASQSSPETSVVTAANVNTSAPSVDSCSVTPDDVLQFWYRDVDPEKNVYASKNWFMGGPDFDKEIEMKFGDCVKLAADGTLDGWKDSVRGRLALVIVLDQFPRNIYRKSPKAYAYDEIALKIVLETIEQGLDRKLDAMERSFFYLPLMHSEKLEVHELAATVFKELAAEHRDNEHLHKYLQGGIDFEKKHRAVLERFGRYPSRNGDLGRQSTPEELEHLSKGPSW